MMLQKNPDKFLHSNGQCEAPASFDIPPNCYTAADLQEMRFPPVGFVLKPILAEGATIFAGRPKLGKSWFMLEAALAVARGGNVFSEWNAEKGDVLFLALEDNARRLQGRLKKLAPNDIWPSNLTIATEAKRIGAGLEEYIRNWVIGSERPRLVVVDTLRFVRPPREKMSYEADYADVGALQRLASETGLAIVAIHHLRKQSADDPLDAISGTTGLSGAADSLVTIARNSEGQIILYARGRDIPESEIEFDFDKETCAWRVAGDPAFNRLSPSRQAILSVLDGESPLGPKDIAECGTLDYDVVRQLLAKMVKDGRIKKTERGLYSLA